MASPQYRYADGVIYRRDPTPYSYDLRIHDLGRGQVEALAMPRYAWTELDATPEALSRAADAQGNVWDSSAGEWVPSTSCGRDLESVLLQIGNVLPVVQRLKFGGSSRRRT